MAYDMLISDWSSDVCSSDLQSEAADRQRHAILDHAFKRGSRARIKLVHIVSSAFLFGLRASPHSALRFKLDQLCAFLDLLADLTQKRDELAVGRLAQIGRASCRERGGQYV